MENSSSMVGATQGVAMVPLEMALATIPKYSGTNIPLAASAERLESVAHLFQEPITHFPDQVTNSLENGARRAVLILPDAEGTTLAQILARLQDLCG